MLMQKISLLSAVKNLQNFLEDDIALISGGTKKIELKRFVDAFVKKSYENYILERELKKLIKAINEELPTK